ncbi:Hypothetical protein SCF082_LOCUS30756 [Durusdinium trenchii]|uniref:Uncharacterized protein n=1 Tax=Durusdinium trenchii TaxID=1381693 RepID=A0ABP0N0Z0_9DINO
MVYDVWGSSVLGTLHGDLRVTNSPARSVPSVTVARRDYAVLPFAKPSDETIGMDMVKAFDDHWIEIPPGWKAYEVGEEFEELVLPKVIAAHSWGTDMVMVRRGKKWPGWRTGIQGGEGAGRRLCSHVDWFETDPAGRRCVFRGEDTQRAPSKKLDPLWQSFGGRVLLERISEEEQLQIFKALLLSEASALWGRSPS